MAEKKRKLGFVGLGLMGQAFTARLMACGHTVTGFDTDGDKTQAATRHGVNAAVSVAEVTANSDIVLMCVTSTDSVEQVVFGPRGIAETADATKILIDHSTTTVEATKRLAARLEAETGMAWVDAPVSGGPSAARAGTLAIMAGGANAPINRVTSLMDDVGASFTHFGPVGAGQTAKMVNQVLVLNNYCVLAEALALAESGGIDASKIPTALASGHAGSNMLQSIFPRMIARDFEPAGYARQVLKDLDMVHDLAKQLGTPTPMSSQTASLFRILNSKGNSELDGISVLKLFDKNVSI